MSAFARRLIAWQRRHGRHGLPWQGTRDPYRIWLAEVMLQQTRIATVLPYYRRFLGRFPDVAALARAPLATVLRLWSGLGYYARARNLHAAARQVARGLGGRFPNTADALARLPGVGRSTAAAIAVFAFGRRAAILDGNVRRVLARHFGVEGVSAQWRCAQALLPARAIATYTQALMDLGATVCTRANPVCGDCPLARTCFARRAGRVAELPAPRRRAARPQRRAVWLVLLERGRVLLERRPPRGLWGGLWAFPELRGRELRRYCRELLGCTLSSIERAPPLRHEFTHFRLIAQPLVCRVRPRGEGQPPGEERAWMTLRGALRAAAPAPVRRLLRFALEQQAERGRTRRAAGKHEQPLARGERQRQGLRQARAQPGARIEAAGLRGVRCATLPEQPAGKAHRVQRKKPDVAVVQRPRLQSGPVPSARWRTSTCQSRRKASARRSAR